jgi:hypothetical protein
MTCTAKWLFSSFLSLRKTVNSAVLQKLRNITHSGLGRNVNEVSVAYFTFSHFCVGRFHENYTLAMLVQYRSSLVSSNLTNLHTNHFVNHVSLNMPHFYIF